MGKWSRALRREGEGDKYRTRCEDSEGRQQNSTDLIKDMGKGKKGQRGKQKEKGNGENNKKNSEKIIIFLTIYALHLFYA